jgi:hypothetical protein
MGMPARTARSRKTKDTRWRARNLKSRYGALARLDNVGELPLA